MTKIFGLNVAKILRNGIKAAGGFPVTTTAGAPATASLVKVVPGTRNPLDLGAGTNPTTVNHPCEAMVDDAELLSQGQTEQGTLRTSRRTVTILGDSLPLGVIPADNDRVVVRGVTYRIVAVKVDPADAAYECTVRGGGV